MRIHILPDIFRSRLNGLHNISENIHWIYSMLRLAVQDSSVEMECVLALADGGTVDTDAIMRRFLATQSAAGWAQMVSQPGLGTAPELAELLSCDLAIGFGLTPALINALHGAGVDILDIEISPLRFGRRQYIRARTNCSKIANVLSAIEVEPDEIVLHAQALAGRHARFRHCDRLGGCELSEKTVGILLGQAHLDLSLVANGRIASMQDDEIFERIRNFSAGVNEMFILPHPLASDRLGNLHRIISEIPNAILDSESSYAFLTDSSTRWVAALSSGGLREAECFGITTHQLIIPDRDNVNLLPSQLGEWIDVYDTIFSPKVWRSIISNDILPSKLPVPDISLVAETLGRAVSSKIDAPPHGRLLTLFPGAIYPINSHGRYNHILRFGWHEPEEWGVWSKLEYACIAFRVKTEHAVVIQLDVKQYAPNPNLPLEVRIRILSGLGFQNLSFIENSGAIKIEVPANGSETVVSIIFHVINPNSPWSVAEGEDIRSLGISVSNISVAAINDKLGPNELYGRFMSMDPEYYFTEKREIIGYRNHSLLTPFVSALARINPRCVVECGASDGAFVSAMAAYASQVVGLDWMPSPKFPFSAHGVSFLKWNSLDDIIPTADLVCSADFLEKLPRHKIDSVIGRMLDSSLSQFHVIFGCDDGNSFLTIDSLAEWLARFQIASMIVETGTDYGVFRICNPRLKSEGRTVSVLTNIPSIVLGF